MLYPFAWLLWKLKRRDFVSDDRPVSATGVTVHQASEWSAVVHRLNACENRPGLKKIYVSVYDFEGAPLAGIKVRFDVVRSYGVAFDSPNVWGLTDENGYLVWEHFGVPTRYVLWVEDEVDPLVSSIRTDLGYEYCRPAGTVLGGWRPINRPGVYSYRVEIRRKNHYGGAA